MTLWQQIDDVQAREHWENETQKIARERDDARARLAAIASLLSKKYAFARDRIQPVLDLADLAQPFPAE